MCQSENRDRDQQTTWSEEQLEKLVLELLETPQGKTVVARVVLGLLTHHEPLKEVVRRIHKKPHGSPVSPYDAGRVRR